MILLDLGDGLFDGRVDSLRNWPAGGHTFCLRQHEAGQDASSTLGYAHRTAQRGDDVDLHAHALLDLAVATPDPQVALPTLDHALDGNVQGAERVNLHAVDARRAAAS